ncbi:MAG: YndJ family transporter [Terriglobales bacterium]
MSSQAFFPSQQESHWSAAVSVAGAAVWAVLAALAGFHQARFGIIELLFLFATLVVVPLGLELVRTLEDPIRVPLGRLLRPFQIVATLSVCIALWIPPGRASAVLSGLWLMLCGVLAGSRFLRWRRKQWSLLSFILDVAHADLVLGAAWLVISRAGFRPMGFQEPIILLTAVHFHYSGFATALIGAATLREFERRGFHLQGLRLLVLLIVLLPFVLAAGFVFSPLLRFGAALALSASVTVLAAILLRAAANLRSRPARIYMRTAGCSALAAFALAGLYAVSEYFAKGWITVPGMANSHGILNSLGFVLLALLAWLTELHGSDPGGERRKDPVRDQRKAELGPAARGVIPSKDDRERRPHRQPSPLPEFVARDFYDR